VEGAVTERESRSRDGDRTDDQHPDPRPGTSRSVQSERTIEALIEAGRAAFNAGATDAGIQTLRRAVEESEAQGRDRLHGRALLALGIALVHIGRGRDGEGATVLHAALNAGAAGGDQRTRAEASRELGYIEFLRARYDRAERWLAAAMDEAPDDIERATALGVLGAVTADLGRTAGALRKLEEAASIGQRRDKPRVEGWARAFAGRTQLLRGELDASAGQLDRALSICRAAAWVSFAPFRLNSRIAVPSAARISAPIRSVGFW